LPAINQTPNPVRVGPVRICPKRIPRKEQSKIVVVEVHPVEVVGIARMLGPNGEPAVTVAMADIFNYCTRFSETRVAVIDDGRRRR